jgi:hypothetical protein
MINRCLFALVSVIALPSSVAFAQQTAEGPPRLVRSRVEVDGRLSSPAAAQFPSELDRQVLLDHLVYQPRACDRGEVNAAPAKDTLAAFRARYARTIYARALANLIFTERNLPYAAMKRAIRELGQTRAPSAGAVLRTVYAQAEVLAERLSNPCNDDADGQPQCANGWVPADAEQITAGYAHGLRRAVLDAAAALRDRDGAALLDQAALAEQPSIRRHAVRHLRALERMR